MANQRFQVLTHLTAEEYEEDARLCAANPGKRKPMLQVHSAINDMSFHEDLIVLLVRDALTQVTDDDEQLGRLDKIDLPHMDLEEWPVEMKAEIMQAGANHWVPRTRYEGGYWSDHRRDAEAFFDTFPELRLMFEGNARETAEAWKKRKEQDRPPHTPDDA